MVEKSHNSLPSCPVVPSTQISIPIYVYDLLSFLLILSNTLLLSIYQGPQSLLLQGEEEKAMCSTPYKYFGESFSINSNRFL